MRPLWHPEDLVAALHGELRAPFAATGVSIDTRTLQPGDLFVALLGERGDGHEYVADALAKGAVGALVHRVPATMPRDAPLFLVHDTLDGLRALAAYARARFTGRVAAITGSVGKTSTKEMLRAIIAPQGRVHAAEASHNNHWGVPLTLARMPPDADAAVVEIGMNHPGEIAPLTRLARPHVAVITAIAPAHIGFLGSLEAIADEKASIMRGLAPGGTAVVPGDSPLLPRLLAAAGEARVMRFGLDAARLHCDAEGTDVTARIGDATVAFRLGAPGRHMVANALAALSAAAALGFDLERGARELAGFAALGGRGARRSIAAPGGEALLLDESYNASPASVVAALRVLGLQPAQRRVVALGDMLELGEHGPAAHAELAPELDRNADLLFACGPLMRHLFDAVAPERRAGYAADAAALAPMVAATVAAGDAVLVKGSLGSRMRLVVDALQGGAR
ncbi:MAG: UDP-N-acetylmuramoyl-tripeptide--D-alanyl-D-alanine ligase [Alphaproteobacteria bacterium]|nr:UDP-N-acetylmuramoyl-tripeptide--D-alanyl-D-alanine ligase [Alphaproteobacteria bacterium]